MHIGETHKGSNFADGVFSSADQKGSFLHAAFDMVLMRAQAKSLFKASYKMEIRHHGNFGQLTYAGILCRAVFYIIFCKT